MIKGCLEIEKIFHTRHNTLFTTCKDIKKVFTTKKKGLKFQSLFLSVKSKSSNPCPDGLSN